MAPIVFDDAVLVAAEAALEKSLSAVEALLKNSTAVVKNSTALAGNPTSAGAAAAPAMVLTAQWTLAGHLVAVLDVVWGVFFTILPPWQLWLVLLASTGAFTANAIALWPRNFRFLAAGAAVLAAAVDWRIIQEDSIRKKKKRERAGTALCS